MDIRTTVTFDEDLWQPLKVGEPVAGNSFRQTLNELLRVALVAATAQPSRCPFRVKPTHMGYRQ
jgi:hypothetical protein